MGLPTSGPISMDDIRAELGVPSQSPFSLDTARAGGYVTLNTNSPTTPPSSGQVSLSSWYGYCQTCDTYNFTYSDTQAIACLNNDPITIISSTIPIGVGSVLTNPDGSQAPPDYYYSDGTNWYYATGNLETTTVTSTGACGGGTATIQIATNMSLDIEIYLSSITVNGVGVTNVSGVDPNTSGNGGSVDTNQLGTYDIVVVYSATTGGQNISLVDSNYNAYCNNTSTGGINSMTFSNVVINGSVNLVLTAGDGTCF
jgi:hypothetical protein